ncbi:unnamed protein product [Paramecium primaurelia]|uniref:Uncharacterized protein n=1 Tax=Paramecium primaurelia TaxID=5886 RepID=A0A8S1Q8E6_PARPR|nr:unnamed protein product [Paramecium primaurelia]
MYIYKLNKDESVKMQQILDKKQQEINVSFMMKIILLQLMQKMKPISTMQDIGQWWQWINQLNIIKMKIIRNTFMIVITMQKI